MRIEPIFTLGLIVAMFAILFYIGLFGFMAIVAIRDYIHRNDKENNND